MIEELRFKEIIADLLDISLEKIKLESDIVDDLGADSLDQIELLMRLEDEYDIEISDEDAMKIKTVQQAQDYINKMT